MTDLGFFQSAADLTEALRLLREMRVLFATIRDQTTRKVDPHAVPITLHDLSSGLVTQLDAFIARFPEQTNG